MTDPLTTATRIRDALTAYIDAAEALPPEVRALLFNDDGPDPFAVESVHVQEHPSSITWDTSSLPIPPWRSTTDTGPSPWTVTPADKWGHIKVEAPDVKPERPDIVKPYRAELWTEWHGEGIGSWVPRSTSKHLESAKASARAYLNMGAYYTAARVIDRRTDAIVWEWAKDVDPTTDNP